jgi:hypothetical protein
LIGGLVGFLVFGPFVGLGVWVSLVFLWFLGVVSGFVLGVSWAILCILFVYLEALCAFFDIKHITYQIYIYIFHSIILNFKLRKCPNQVLVVTWFGFASPNWIEVESRPDLGGFGLSPGDVLTRFRWVLAMS